MTLSGFGLKEWPFALIPDSERAHIWAGRHDLRDRLRGLVRAWGYKKASEIDIFWADWGQGKSHTLFHLQSLLSRDSSAIVHYVQLPPLAGMSQPFKALFDQIMLEFPLGTIATKVYDHFEPDNNFAQLFSPAVRNTWPSHVLQLLWMIKTKGPGSYIAERYLRGQRVTQRELNHLRVGDRVIQVPPSPKTAQDCQNILSDLVKIVINFPNPSGSQFVLLIDEFQRIAALGQNKMKQVCDSLHLIYNSNPNCLRLLFAFATGDPNSLRFTITGDLRSRVSNTFGLPPPSREEVTLYVKELLRSYQIEQQNQQEFDPFDPAAAKLLCDYAYDTADGYCTLRNINLVFDRCFFQIIEDRRLTSDDSLTGEARGPISLIEVSRAIESLDSDIKATLSSDFKEES